MNPKGNEESPKPDVSLFGRISDIKEKLEEEKEAHQKLFESVASLFPDVSESPSREKISKSVESAGKTGVVALDRIRRVWKNRPPDYAFYMLTVGMPDVNNIGERWLFFPDIVDNGPGVVKLSSDGSGLTDITNESDTIKDVSERKTDTWEVHVKSRLIPKESPDFIRAVGAIDMLQEAVPHKIQTVPQYPV